MPLKNYSLQLIRMHTTFKVMRVKSQNRDKT